MFKENFIRLCNKKNESPSSVCVKIGITPATYSCWTDKSVPRKATLMKIANYFNVTVEELLEEEKKPILLNGVDNFVITPKERRVVTAYRDHPELQPVIDKILDIPLEENDEIYVAAESDRVNVEKEVISEDLARRLIEAPAKDKL